MLDFGYACSRETSPVAGLISPGAGRGNHKVFFGNEEIMIPVYGSIAAAAEGTCGAPLDPCWCSVQIGRRWVFCLFDQFKFLNYIRSLV